MEQIIKDLEKVINSLKKCYNNSLKTSEPSKKTIQYNAKSKELIVEGQKKQLTINEGVIIEELIKSENMFCTYNQLCQKLYNCNYNHISSSALNKTINRLRKKLKGMIILKTKKEIGIKMYAYNNQEKENK